MLILLEILIVLKVGIEKAVSKAFTKELESQELELDVSSNLPKGAKNYITPGGLVRLQTELKNLNRIERPKVVEVVSWAASNGDRSENGDYIYGKKKLREIDRRIRFLLKRLEIAEPVDPMLQTKHDQVFFGAIVTYCEDGDKKRTVRIVGVDEVRSDKGEVSWVSPIARALMQRRVGEEVKLSTPKGIVDIEVLEISYQDNRLSESAEKI